MAKACTALAIADHNQCCKTKALTALYGLGDAVDVDQLLDELFAAIFFSVVTLTTITTVAAFATTLAAATATATSVAGLTFGGCAFRGALLDFSVFRHLRTPIRLHEPRRPEPSRDHGTGSRHGRTPRG